MNARTYVLLHAYALDLSIATDWCVLAKKHERQQSFLILYSVVGIRLDSFRNESAADRLE